MYHSQLPFISEEDKNEISKITKYKDLRNFLVKYKELIFESVKTLGIATSNPVDFYANTIMKSKYYEDCLKASSEFDIPLVIVDKLYYFNKILSESSVYDDETKEEISKFYIKSDDSKRRDLFNVVAEEKDVSSIMKLNENRNISFTA